MGFGAEGPYFIPNLIEPVGTFPFSEWWEMPIIINQITGVELTRKLAILELANTDGGAHVDPGLNPPYRKLSRDNGMGWQVSPQTDAPLVRTNPAFPTVRQITHEVLWTLRQQLPILLAEYVSASA
jgi:hypothetical protein